MTDHVGHILCPSERRASMLIDAHFGSFTVSGCFYCLRAEPGHSGGPGAWEPASAKALAEYTPRLNFLNYR